MIKCFWGALMVLAAMQVPSFASFDFQLSTVSFDGTSGVVKVSVTPVGEPGGNLTNVSGFASPITFSGMSNANVGVPSVLPSGGFPATNPVTPLVSSANQKIDFTAGFFTSPTLSNGTTLDLYTIPFTLTQPGTLTLTLATSGIVSGTNDLGITEILPPTFTENFLAGSITGSSQSFVSAVPEPSSFLFMGLVGVCVGGVRWFKKRAA